MNGDGWADAGHKRRLENRLMVRWRDPYGSRSVWPESSSELRGQVTVEINIAAGLWASQQYQIQTWQGGEDRSRDPRFFALSQIRHGTAIEFSFNGCRIGVQGLKVEVELELEPLLQAAMFKALLTIRGIQFAPDGGLQMHISSTGPVTSTQPATSKTVPPGLAKRDLVLPPGIAKKLAAGGTPPPGIAKRFPAAIVPPTSDTTETETGGGAPAADASSPDNTTSSVDLLV